MLIPAQIVSHLARRGQAAPRSLSLSPLSLFSGVVHSVPDGDGLLLAIHGDYHQIRLFGIDAPEMGQPYGSPSRDTLARAILGKLVLCSSRLRDKYGRLVCDVYNADSILISLYMVQCGAAWWFRRYAPDDKRFESAERVARQERRGLWRHPEPVPPWAWRAKHPH